MLLAFLPFPLPPNSNSNSNSLHSASSASRSSFPLCKPMAAPKDVDAAAAAASKQLHFTLPLIRLRAASTLRLHDTPSSPLQTSATVPFRWEEKPGVPRSCLTLTAINHHQRPLRCLELPPCRIFPQTPSPTSVLDVPRKFSSFRLLSGRGSPDFDYINGFLGSGRKKKGGSFRFSSPSNSSWESDEICASCADDKLMKKKRGLMIPQTRPRHLLGNICKGLKHVIQWTNGRKIHKESIINE